MSYTFPEKPLLLYPSLACRIGVEPALLLGLYHEAAQVSGITDQRGGIELLLAHSQWLALAPFWDEERLRELSMQLVERGMINIAWGSAGNLRIRFSAPPVSGVQIEPDAEPVAQVQAQAPVRRLPVVDTPPPPPRPAPAAAGNRNLVQRRGPAPTFGGSIGWRRHKDELQSIFEQAELRNSRLQSMFIGWQPSELFQQMLPRYAIPGEFAEGCIDEFVLYFLDKDRKESNWDQKFLAWVKREWVKKQTQDARDQRYQQERESAATGVGHENTRPDSREKRKRVTAAIMDIKDTDW